jgi:hypothetical protein
MDNGEKMTGFCYMGWKGEIRFCTFSGGIRTLEGPRRITLRLFWLFTEPLLKICDKIAFSFLDKQDVVRLLKQFPSDIDTKRTSTKI